jgi:phosphonatase-like hydrolase
MIDYYRVNPDVREVPGAIGVFRTLRSHGIRVALDTGFDRQIVDVLIGRLGWEEEVDATAASDEVPHGRPFPDLIFKLMEILGVESAANVVKVGDTPSDLQEGTAAGCGMVIGVTSGTHVRSLLEPHPHTHLVDSVRDIPALLLSGV